MGVHNRIHSSYKVLLSDCPHGWSSWSTSCYRHINTSFTWSSALATCSALGSNLVTVQSKTENSFVANLSSGSSFWTGGILLPSTDSWQWNGGDPWNWTGWSIVQPAILQDACLLVKHGKKFYNENQIFQLGTFDHLKYFIGDFANPHSLFFTHSDDFRNPTDAYCVHLV